MLTLLAKTITRQRKLLLVKSRNRTLSTLILPKSMEVITKRLIQFARKLNTLYGYSNKIDQVCNISLTLLEFYLYNYGKA